MTALKSRTLLSWALLNGDIHCNQSANQLLNRLTKFNQPKVASQLINQSTPNCQPINPRIKQPTNQPTNQPELTNQPLNKQFNQPTPNNQTAVRLSDQPLRQPKPFCERTNQSADETTNRQVWGRKERCWYRLHSSKLYTLELRGAAKGDVPTCVFDLGQGTAIAKRPGVCLCWCACAHSSCLAWINSKAIGENSRRSRKFPRRLGNSLVDRGNFLRPSGKIPRPSEKTLDRSAIGSGSRDRHRQTTWCVLVVRVRSLVVPCVGNIPSQFPNDWGQG